VLAWKRAGLTQIYPHRARLRCARRGAPTGATRLMLRTDFWVTTLPDLDAGVDDGSALALREGQDGVHIHFFNLREVRTEHG
jgi:hypothetical protein